MGNHLLHLTLSDRASIPTSLQAKLNGSAIARQLDFSRYTIHRAINRSHAPAPTALAWVLRRPVVAGPQPHIAALFALAGVAPPSRAVRRCKSRAAAVGAIGRRSVRQPAAAAGAAP